MIAALPGPDLTPLEAVRRLAGRPGRFLLHSGSDADGCGTWSFAGAEPEAVLALSVRDGDGALFERLQAFVGEGPIDPSGPLPRAIGWLGYDLGRAIERLPAHAPDDLEVPDIWMARHRAVWRHHGPSGRAAVVGDDEAAVRRLHAALSTPAGHPPAPPPVLGGLVADEPPARHLEAVARALEYIRAGDVYQVNLARRLSARVVQPGDPLALYERVARQAPAPFGAFLEAGPTALISNSPELFLRRAAGGARLETRPIKGTRARAVPPDVLAADPKERAEHLMIVDLERNDLGKVAVTGSVAVEGFSRLVTLPTVHHLVSTVSCRIPPTCGHARILAATVPGGSVTGAPKIRAMEIIDELEPTRRGPYTGAVGWLGARGAMELSIVIRTALVTGGALRLHVGGGIVADSTPARELAETEEKAAAWRAALG